MDSGIRTAGLERGCALAPALGGTVWAGVYNFAQSEDTLFTIASTHSGGEGVGVGARAVGISHLWGIEYRQDIAAVAENNGFRSIVSAVESVALRDLEAPDILHSSPVCKRASVANAKRGEIAEDVQSGETVAAFIRYLRPKLFTLENVWGYRKFEAFKVICNALEALGYRYDVTHLNCADFGVPQTRKRLVLRATRYRKKHLPPYPAKEPWIGWYAAIEDLIPTLPESQFAPWQLKRLDASVLKRMGIEPNVFVGGANKSESFLQFAIDNRKSIPGIRNGSAPMSTVPSDNATIQAGRAFLADGKLNDRSSSLTTREGETRCFSLTTSHNTRDIKAFIVPGANRSNENPARDAEEPSGTITAHQKQVMTTRAFIANTREMHDHRELNPLTVRHGEEPLYTLSATSMASRNKAWLERGRVVKMTPRALARFQSFPDTYLLPDKVALACTVIGNAVPPLLYQKIVQQLVDTL